MVAQGQLSTNRVDLADAAHAAVETLGRGLAGLEHAQLYFNWGERACQAFGIGRELSLRGKVRHICVLLHKITAAHTAEPWPKTKTKTHREDRRLNTTGRLPSSGVKVPN
jgi:hypothetical protein